MSGSQRFSSVCPSTMKFSLTAITGVLRARSSPTIRRANSLRSHSPRASVIQLAEDGSAVFTLDDDDIRRLEAVDERGGTELLR